MPLDLSLSLCKLCCKVWLASLWGKLAPFCASGGSYDKILQHHDVDSWTNLPCRSCTEDCRGGIAEGDLPPGQAVVQEGCAPDHHLFPREEDWFSWSAGDAGFKLTLLTRGTCRDAPKPGSEMQHMLSACSKAGHPLVMLV